MPNTICFCPLTSSLYAVLTLGLVIALRLQTPKHIRGGWSHYTDTSESVDGNGAQNMFTVQSGFEHWPPS
jgi:hypothetical protein